MSNQNQNQYIEIKNFLINKINEEFKKTFSHDNFENHLKKSHKTDRSVVTHIDIFISKLCETLLTQAQVQDQDQDQVQNQNSILKNYTLFSEEDEDSNRNLKFPALILDPIDGTKELSMGIGECALSFSLFNSPELSDPLNYGLIYNPFTGFTIDSLIDFTPAKNYFSDNLRGFVSITEWERGLFHNHINKAPFKRTDTNENATATIMPVGSIAFKLGLLSAGIGDFIVSFKPKNIWDVAAGTLLASKHGFNFYEGKNHITSLEKEKYFPPLYWCRSQDAPYIFEQYS
ncbi:MAG: hypothetical protein HQK49_08460 [Oligoflexia bacterium]|nr:hypothetical protein [Oligoflexia bacterium]